MSRKNQSILRKIIEALENSMGYRGSSGHGPNEPAPQTATGKRVYGKSAYDGSDADDSQSYDDEERELPSDEVPVPVSRVFNKDDIDE